MPMSPKILKTKVNRNNIYLDTLYKHLNILSGGLKPSNKAKTLKTLQITKNFRNIKILS